MLDWFQAIMPKDARFFDLFEAHAQTIVDGARSLRSMLEGGDDVPRLCREIAEHEAAADAVARDVTLAVRRTFITPFDRSDILNLTGLMDDAVDQMHKTAKSVLLFEVRRFEPAMVELGDLIVRCADLTAQATPLLRKLKPNAAQLNGLAEEIARLEEESDRVYDRGMAELYRGPAQQNAMAFIVGAEVYEHLEKVVDRMEDVAGSMSGVLIEHL